MCRILPIVFFFLFLTPILYAKEKSEFKQNLKLICCESFGYGSRMKKCCESYKMVPAEKCKIPNGIVGGGMIQVHTSFCKKSQP